MSKPSCSSVVILPSTLDLRISFTGDPAIDYFHSLLDATKIHILATHVAKVVTLIPQKTSAAEFTVDSLYYAFNSERDTTEGVVVIVRPSFNIL